MICERIKVYLYTRVSTAMQIDGYSLEAQRNRMRAYAEFNNFEIVGEYEDAGKSGKSIEGRQQFQQMLKDIQNNKDGVSYVLVFKLSRFGRNAADVLSTLQVMQDYGVNLICVEDGIDSSKDAGKLMISVLSAVAEIERENIRVQTMEGRMQKAKEGRWNGGFAPYGYSLVDGNLVINEEEAKAIRLIFKLYITMEMGANGVAAYLANHGIKKIPRQNGKTELFTAHFIRMIIANPVYCGKIAYGRRKTEKVHGTRNEYRLVKQEDFLVVDGLHEALISEADWEKVQYKRKIQAEKYEHINTGKNEKIHLLSGILKCPICNSGMYGNKNTKVKADGTKYKDNYFYRCRHRKKTNGYECSYRKQINEEKLDKAVSEIIIKLVSNPKFARKLKAKINMEVDTTMIDKEIENYQKQIRIALGTKENLISEIDSLDYNDRHYERMKKDLNERLYKMYDNIADFETRLKEAIMKKNSIQAEKITGENVYKILLCFEKLYDKMNEKEKRELMELLINEIHIFEEEKENGQWLKSINFRLPLLCEDVEFWWDNDTHVETVIMMQHSRK